MTIYPALPEPESSILSSKLSGRPAVILQSARTVVANRHPPKRSICGEKLQFGMRTIRCNITIRLQRWCASGSVLQRLGVVAGHCRPVAEACLVFDMERLKNRDLKTQFRRRGRVTGRCRMQEPRAIRSVCVFKGRMSVKSLGASPLRTCSMQSSKARAVA